MGKVVVSSYKVGKYSPSEYFNIIIEGDIESGNYYLDGNSIQVDKVISYNTYYRLKSIMPSNRKVLKVKFMNEEFNPDKKYIEKTLIGKKIITKKENRNNKIDDVIK